ncbi:pLS20_p028 family conjugation system transmembrane protein [Weissella cibaria]|uniref:DUF8208 domain-containing protein n=1 Tax=Weissella cibaria TaxID=137591 RepID=A0A0D1LM61_9LACO|nr:hypothetical protein [Weissella cibaria]KIU19787.1 hypothetical protein QX99_01808 [Weissella cibaria]MDV8929038.1 hypothetical protein [Weissella cibaria]
MLLSFMALPTGGPTNEFYESWADYLQPYPTIFLKTAAIFGQWLATLFYNLGNAVLEAWNGAWKIANFSSLFTSKHADGMTGFQLTQYIGLFFMIGLMIMSIMMAIQIMQFSMTSGRRGKEWPAGIVTAFIIIWVVPLLITSGLSIGKAANTQMLGNAQQQNILTKIWRSNTVDLKKLAEANFDVSGDNPNKFSPITDSSSNDAVKSTIFTQIMDEDAIKKISGKASKEVFKNKLGENTKVELDKGSFLTKSAAAEVYPRVKTNWFGIIAAEIVFAVVGFLAIVELLVRFYRLAYYSITLLVFAFRDMEGKKAMQILHVMEGSIIGVAILPLNLLLFFGFIQWGTSTIGNSNLGWAPYTILIIAIMVAGMKGLFGGFALIDDWTGVPTGGGQSLMGMVGAASTAASVGRGAANVGKSVGNGVRNTGNVAKAGVENMADKFSKVGERAAKMREGAFDSMNESGKIPNAPMPAGKNSSGSNGAPTFGSKDTDDKSQSAGLDAETLNSGSDTPTPVGPHDGQGTETDAPKGFAGFTGPNGEPAQPVNPASSNNDNVAGKEGVQDIPTVPNEGPESGADRADNGYTPRTNGGTIDVPFNNPNVGEGGSQSDDPSSGVGVSLPDSTTVSLPNDHDGISSVPAETLPVTDAKSPESKANDSSHISTVVPPTSNAGGQQGYTDASHSAVKQPTHAGSTSSQDKQTTSPTGGLDLTPRSESGTTSPLDAPQSKPGHVAASGQQTSTMGPTTEANGRKSDSTSSVQPASETPSAPKAWKDMTQEERAVFEYEELKAAAHVELPSYLTNSSKRKNGRD